MTRPIRTLLFSTLYPSEVRPIHGIFVETRLRELLKSGQVQSRVVAPIGVCKALMDSLAELGGEPAKLNVFRNGVDLERFTPEPRDLARERLGLPPERRQLLSVGHLIERKGHHIAIEALPLLPDDIELSIIGTGPERTALEALATRLGVSSRVRFAGQIPQIELKWWYSAADILLLCSSREGWANVLLEGMACGTPVVATNIWGTPEVVSTPDAGLLMRERNAPALAESVLALFAANPERAAVRHHAEGFSWEQTTQDQLRLFRSIL